MILELHFVNYIHIFFGPCHVTFPYKEILSFFGSCHVTFPYMELLPFLFVKKVIVSCFTDSFVQKATPQSDGSCIVTNDSQFWTNFSKNTLFISANKYEKYIVIEEYCIVPHHDKMCFLPNCRYHILLKGNLKELLQKLNAFCFNNQQVDCLHTLFKYRFTGITFVKNE